MYIKKSESEELINMGNILYKKDIELFNKLQEKSFTFNVTNSQIMTKETNGGLLLKQEEEKYLIYKLNQLKTIIFVDLMLYDENFSFLNSMLNDIMKIKTEEEDDDKIIDDDDDDKIIDDDDDDKIIDDDTLKINKKLEASEIKKYFNMTYSEEDKNKKKISHENRNRLLLIDIKIIQKEMKYLNKQIDTGKLTEKKYEEKIEKLIQVINKINPTMKFYKKCIMNINKTNKTEDELIIINKDINNIELSIVKIKDIIEILIKFNIRLVISIVKNYRNKVPNKIDFEDLKNEGVIGLMNAIYKFDVNTTNKLSTYSTWWIRQHIIHYINKNKNTIYTPLYYTKTISEYEKIKLEGEKHGKYFNDYEVAEIMGISIKQLKKAIKIIKSTQTISLNQSNSDDDDFSLEDVASSENSDGDDMTRILLNEETKKMIEEAIEELNPKEKYIIKERLELFNDNPKTLEELGKKLSRTRERIRQLEVEAFKKLERILRANGIDGI